MPRCLQKSCFGSSLSAFWGTGCFLSTGPSGSGHQLKPPEPRRPSKDSLHPRVGSMGLLPSVPRSLDVSGNWTGQVWSRRGAGREETAPVFSAVYGKDVSSPLRPEDVSSLPGREPPSALGCDLPWVGPWRPPANSQDSFVSSNNVKSRASSDQDTRPDILWPSGQPQTPAPVLRVWGGIQSTPKAGRQQQEKKKKTPSPVLSNIHSWNPEKPP